MDPWLIVFITLLLSAFFSGMEIAFISSNKLKMEVDKSKGLLSARILSGFINRPSRFIGSLLLGNNVALVIYGIAMTLSLEQPLSALFPDGLANEFSVFALQTLVSTLLILIVAEFLPKALFRIKPNAILNAFAIPLGIFYYLFYPFIYLFIGFAEFLLKTVFRIRIDQEKYVFSPIDLDEYVKEFSPGAEEGIVNQEMQMFQNAMEFKNIKVRECMIPRTEIVAAEENESTEELKNKFVESGHSKIPVFRDTIDNVIGYTHSFDMFKNPQHITDFLKNIMILPETGLAADALRQMTQEHKSIAVVVDEFGGTSGIVTMEDIIEEIFGEIEDEYDTEEMVERLLNKGEFVFSARLEIDYLNEKYNLNLPESEEYETLAGLIISEFASIPQTNQEIEIDDYVFNILEATDTRIDLVHMKIKEF